MFKWTIEQMQEWINVHADKYLKIVHMIERMSKWKIDQMQEWINVQMNEWPNAGVNECLGGWIAKKGMNVCPIVLFIKCRNEWMSK